VGGGKGSVEVFADENVSEARLRSLTIIGLMAVSVAPSGSFCEARGCWVWSRVDYVVRINVVRIAARVYTHLLLQHVHSF
jgi:hypothetical protein